MFIVVTPTYDARAANWPILSERIRSQGAQWHVLRSPTDVIPGPVCDAEFFMSGPEPLHDACYLKLNWWLENYGEPKGNWIHFVMDDELMPKDFYSLLRPDPITYCTMLRGHHSPKRTLHRHGCSTQEANIHYANPGLCGLLQVVIRDDLALSQRFHSLTYSAGQDGDYVSLLVKRNKDKVVFRPEIRVFFNALEEGRWDTIPE